MSVHKKLMQARVKLQATEMKKSGLNKFAGYTYFELGDFIPHVQTIFNDLGLCGVVSFDTTHATLCITDVEDGTQIVITSPMAEANLKGAHPIQNLGAVESYQRRYLWMTALELVEHDIIDSSPRVEEKAEPKPEPKVQSKSAPRKMEGKDKSWQLVIEAEEGLPMSEWVKLVFDISVKGLEQVTCEDDILELFKVNRTIFDKMKAEDEEQHKELMKLFRNRTNELKGE
jgi:hypothetical protein